MEPEIIVDKPKKPIWRKLAFGGVSLATLLVGLVVVVGYKDPATLATVYIAFVSGVTTVCGAFMYGNAQEHKSALSSAAGAISTAMAALGKPPEAPKP